MMGGRGRPVHLVLARLIAQLGNCPSLLLPPPQLLLLLQLAAAGRACADHSADEGGLE